MVNFCVFDTAHGWIALVGRDGKLIESTLPKKTREDTLSYIDAGLDETYVEDRSAFGDLPSRLERYFAGERVDFSDVEIDVSWQAPFIAAAQIAARGIPYGTVITYRDLAGMAGNQKAARAAGTAMANNTMPIIVPCHRVIASGGIGGFALGLEWKRTLLMIEGVKI